MSELKISPELLQISPEVQDALKNKKPVVALESTIISHGMPFPQNAQTAIEVEETIRKQGAVPATIAIIGGVMKVGLSKEEIELLGREGHNVTKVSRRDLPFVVAAGKNGATTVASTMIIAALAGIKVFATGGIGGVHRGAEHTFDISADLQELANTNVTVVCAGAKSILDLGLTTEYLETFGVPLIGYQTKALPAFFCRTSPFEVSIRLDSATEIARAMAVSPSVLLMDEPASALDPISTAKVEELIHELKKDYTIVIVTHNMQQAARVSDKTAFFYMGEMVEFDNTKKIFTNPEKEATQNYITGRFG